MSESEHKLEAQRIYENMCAAFDGAGLKYTRHDEDLVLTYGVSGDDIPMEFIALVNEKARVVRIYSKLPVKVEEDKIVDAAIAVACANDAILNGAFNLDIAKGIISFNVLTAYHNTVLDPEIYIYLAYVASSTVDMFNDRFLMLAKGIIDLEKFIEMTNN